MARRTRLQSEPNLSAKLEAFSFQEEAVKTIRDLDYAAVFHEQGLGKSKIAMDLLLYWLEKRMVDTVLLVAKKGLLQNWLRELKAHTHLIPKLLDQNHRSNYYSFVSPSRLVLTHFEVLKSERKRFKLFLKARDVGIIIDESAKIKNPDSELTRVFFELSPLFKKRVILTGTPIANRPYDIWAQIWFLDHGKSLGSDFISFHRETDLSNSLAQSEVEQERFEEGISSIHDRLSSFCVRETKNSGIIKLPDKMIENIRCDWEPQQRELYGAVRNDLRAVIVKEGVPTIDVSEDILKRLLRLVQIASNPSLIDDNYTRAPGKFDYLVDLVERIVMHSEKCIIWSTFTENVDWLGRELRSYGIRKMHGKNSMHERQRAIDSFLSDPSARILVTTPGAAKEGLTLTVANHVIFFDRGFSLDDYLQAQDRIHRISQEKTCYVHNLIMPDSIDEWVDILLNEKHLAAQLGQNDISIEYYRSKITYGFAEAIRKVLGIREQDEEKHDGHT